MLSTLLLLALPIQLTPHDMVLDAATRAAVLDKAAGDLDESYVLPEVARRMAEMLQEKKRTGAYDSITSAVSFAQQLTTDLQAISHDKHLRVRYSEELLPPEEAGHAGADEDPSPAELERMRAEAERENFAFVRVERLEGNVGYIDFRRFFPAALGKEKATQAMQFVADTDALIFDMRWNGGGSPDLIAWICSYLFEERVHLNDLYFRPGDHTEQFWTDPGVPGRKYEKEVFVLTSSRTFSGAEEFSYNLQTQKRATLVGETTGGGANPGGPARLHDHFTMFLPIGRAINPITKTNWEGVGVQPDVPTRADQALARAHALALEGLLDMQPDVLTVERKSALNARNAELEGKPAKN